MTVQLPEHLLANLSELVSARTGLLFVRERWPDLERGLRAAAPEFGFSEVEACAEWLLSSPLNRSQIEILAGSLTVGETYFFRDPGNFEILQRHILPEMIQARRNSDRQLRIWSAGCCTGEEPYSVAILLNQLIPDLPNWHLSLLATDINPKFLARAALGVYGEWSFRNKPPGIKEQYFTRLAGNRFELMQSIKTMVRFSHLNLVEDTYPLALTHTTEMDVIFCRNVLMYFAPHQARQVIDRLYRSLTAGGWLIVSPTEASHTLFAQFRTVNFPNAILYQKVVESDDRLRNPEPEPDWWQPEAEINGPQPPAVFGPEIGQPVPAGLEAPSLPLITDEAAANQPSLSVTGIDEVSALYGQGRYVEAEAAAGKLLADTPGDVKPLTLLARLSANQGKLAEALAWCEQALTLDRLNPGGYYLQAVIYQEQGQVELAAQSLRRALYLEPEMTLAHFALGNLALRQGQFREADRHFGSTLALLGQYRSEDILPESDGLTAGRIRAIITATVFREQAV